MPARIALATCQVLPEPDPDQELMLQAFRLAGMECEMLAWDDQNASVEGWDAIIIRSTWNYYLDPEGFRAWLKKASLASRLFNPEPVVSENLHKKYLLELEARGLPIVPTLLMAKGQVDLASLQETGWSDIVIKPAISASSWRTKRCQAGSDEADSFLAELAAVRDVLIQPYLKSVETGGERSLIWIDGEFTHKIVKQPRFVGQDESVSLGEGLTEEELRMGRDALSGLEGDLLYARVDVMDIEKETVISEVELAEPSLFFMQNPAALERFVGAVQKRLDS